MAASCKWHLPSPSCSTRAIKESLSQNILDNFLEQNVRRGGYSPPPPPPPPPPEKTQKKKPRKGMGNQTTALRLQTGGWHEWPDIASLLLGAGKTEQWFRNKNWKSGHSLTLASLASGLYIDIYRYASFNSQHIHSKMIVWQWHPHSNITSSITVVSKRRTVHGKGLFTWR